MVEADHLDCDRPDHDVGGGDHRLPFVAGPGGVFVQRRGGAVGFDAGIGQPSLWFHALDSSRRLYFADFRVRQDRVDPVNCEVSDRIEIRDAGMEGPGETGRVCSRSDGAGYERAGFGDLADLYSGAGLRNLHGRFALEVSIGDSGDTRHYFTDWLSFS